MINVVQVRPKRPRSKHPYCYMYFVLVYFLWTHKYNFHVPKFLFLIPFSTLDEFTSSLKPDTGLLLESHPSNMENFTGNNSLLYWHVSQLSTANLKFSTVWTFIFTITYTVIFLFGFIGNFTVIVTICKKIQMRTVTNLFIFNLALADLLVIVFCVPVTLAANIFKRKFTVYG